jgi:SAM-dependent methyltransferase
MTGDVRFEPDLYRGTAGYYDRFRLPYPDAMIADLVRRTAPSGRGRLLDLACGTGQLAFPLRASFADVWCVDAEPGMTEVVRAKAIAVGAVHIRTITVGAEDLPAGPDSFESIVIGNAFHRLRPPTGRVRRAPDSASHPYGPRDSSSRRRRRLRRAGSREVVCVVFVDANVPHTNRGCCDLPSLDGEAVEQLGCGAAEPGRGGVAVGRIWRAVVRVRARVRQATAWRGGTRWMGAGPGAWCGCEAYDVPLSC